MFSQYLCNQIGGYLPPFGNNEGQMAPDVRDMMRTEPWQNTDPFDWAYIRSRWEALSQGQIFVEASPPNLIRVDDIAPVFGHDSTAIVSICNPYQHIPSVLRRRAKSADSVAHVLFYRMIPCTSTVPQDIGRVLTIGILA